MKHLHYSLVIAIVVSVMALVTLAPAGAEPPEGKGNKPKDDIGKSVEGFLYGDLYVVERDGNGEPFVYESGNCVDADTGIACAQPLMADCSYVPIMCNYEGDWKDDPELLACLIANGVEDPLGLEDPDNVWEPELCDLHPCFVDTVQEVHFGRMSVVRTTPDVVDKAYDEALSSLNAALGVSQDLAGRIVLDLPLLDEDGEPVVDANGIVTYAKTIDSPLENLALYREMMVNECLGEIEVEYIGEGGADVTEIHYLEQSAINLLNNYEPYAGFAPLKPLVCPYDDPEALWEPTTPDQVTADDLGDHSLAAVFLGAAADKGGHITLDMIVNANTYLEINPYDEPAKGEAPMLTYHEFLADSGSGWYEYNQASTFVSTASATLLTPASDCGGGDCYCVAEVFAFGDGLQTVDFVNSSVPVCRNGELLRVGFSDDPADPLYYCREDSYSTDLYNEPSIYGGNPMASGCGGANWFTQAAEDARQVIWFLHNWSIPEYEAPVP